MSDASSNRAGDELRAPSETVLSFLEARKLTDDYIYLTRVFGDAALEIPGSGGGQLEGLVGKHRLHSGENVAVDADLAVI